MVRESCAQREAAKSLMIDPASHQAMWAKASPWGHSMDRKAHLLWAFLIPSSTEPVAAQSLRIAISFR